MMADKEWGNKFTTRIKKKKRNAIISHCTPNIAASQVTLRGSEGGGRRTSLATKMVTGMPIVPHITLCKGLTKLTADVHEKEQQH